ncbi:MAG: ABC transporter ATP-binding protein [Paludibacteraceae bacterium]|nr:ABC transporter ATP-binding protein [Paludibacteraceae bacterium]
MLEVNNVTKSFATHLALDNVSLTVRRNSIFGLLGPNGAGKTTLIRIINSIIAADSGTVTIDGHKLTLDDTHRIGYLPEERGLYRKMKVGEQALYLAQLKGLSKSDANRRLREWFDKFDIMPWWNKKVEELSKGMAQKIQFITTVLHQPELLIFDEPFSGFDPVNAELLKEEILRLRDNGATIIFSTHNMDSVERLCDDIALINKSRIVLSGNVAEIREKHSSGKHTLTYSINGKTCTDIVPSANINSTLQNLLNSNATILSLNQQLPSMNDIFIQTVKQ